MMKTLVIYRSHNIQQNKSGFTLIELLVVLMIFGLLAGMAVPRLVTMYDSVQTAYEKEEILSKISGLNYQAFRQGKKFRLSKYPIEKREIVTVEGFGELEGNEDGIEYVEESIDFVEYAEEEETVEIVEDIPLELPEGWKLRTESPILFRANGACSGGIIHLQLYDEAEFSVELFPPFCRASRSQLESSE